jgi:hypothetical protein
MLTYLPTPEILRYRAVNHTWFNASITTYHYLSASRRQDLNNLYQFILIQQNASATDEQRLNAIRLISSALANLTEAKRERFLNQIRTFHPELSISQLVAAEPSLQTAAAHVAIRSNSRKLLPIALFLIGIPYALAAYACYLIFQQPNIPLSLKASAMEFTIFFASLLSMLAWTLFMHMNNLDIHALRARITDAFQVKAYGASYLLFIIINSIAAASDWSRDKDPVYIFFAIFSSGFGILITTAPILVARSIGLGATAYQDNPNRVATAHAQARQSLPSAPWARLFDRTSPQRAAAAMRLDHDLTRALLATP